MDFGDPGRLPDRCPANVGIRVLSSNPAGSREHLTKVLFVEAQFHPPIVTDSPERLTVHPQAPGQGEIPRYRLRREVYAAIRFNRRTERAQKACVIPTVMK